MPPYFLIMTRGLFAEKGERDRGGEWGKEGRVWGAGMRFCTFLVKGRRVRSQKVHLLLIDFHATIWTKSSSPSIMTLRAHLNHIPQLT